MTTETPPKALTKSQAATVARSDLYFLLYASLGSERSVRAVREVAIRAGMRPSLSTLTEYSTRFEWVRRAGEFDAQVAAAREHVLLEDAISDGVAHRTLADLMVEVAQKGLTLLLGDEERLKKMNGTEMARLGREGFNIGRTVNGEVSSIEGVMGDFYSHLFPELGGLFLAAMDASNAVYARHGAGEWREEAQQAAAAVFGPGADRIIEQHFRVTGLTQLEAPKED